ncbi:MAG: glycoside hydrolase family 31 protein [Clostridiaceae bacterium]|nr:glycoside hydrolase family 31 protein [Clostridiaceae bacterium]
MNNTTVSKNKILFSRNGELVRITPCHENAIRFEAFPDCKEFDEDFTLMPQSADAVIEEKDHCVFMTVGSLKVQLERNGKLTFYKDGSVILEEKPELAFFDGYRHYERNNGSWSARITFKSKENEHFYGLGHEASNKFDLKGCSFDMRHVNAKCTIPFVYSSLGYGFIWNNPAVGNVELSDNRTRWSVGATKKIDFVVIAGNPKQVSETLADLTGHAPVMPHWATGFWQSRLRYETQEDLLEVARRYKDEGVPLSVIIADYFHWTEQGDYKFDPKYWPDVKAMTDELHSMGTKLVVSVWPTINENSENYWYMRDNNMLIRTTKGSNKVFDFYGPQAEIDATNPATRKFVFSKLKENYLDNGVDGVWFDEAEPEIHPEHFGNLIYHVGRGDEYGLIYPYYYSKMAYDGFTEMGETPVILTRAAYLGSQKFGSLVWSGDIYSDFESLCEQVKAGLNMSMCGIPWWNTDIGGFWGGDTQSEMFRELIVRWFQYGVFSPVMRVHGNRHRHGEKKRDVKEPSGDPNEIWSFGEENFPILKELVLLRERLRPYIEKQMTTASEKGYPIMRPMFFEYPDDKICYNLGEQYMFGDDILFAPIVNRGQTEKQVYLPEGEWVLTKSGETYTKGWHTVTAQINEFVAFVKKGADVLSCFKSV